MNNLPETPYGNYRDFDSPPHWSDDFEMEMWQKRTCNDLYDEYVKECADVCGYDTSDWTLEDWEIFEELLEEMR